MAVQETPGSGEPDFSRYRAWYAWVLKHTRWIRPALMWLGHYILWLLGAYVLLSLANDLSARPGWLILAVGAYWFTMLGVIIFAMTYHQAKLCARCGGSTPLDPQAAVGRWKPALRLHHRQGIVMLMVLASMIWQVAVGLLLIQGVHALHLPPHHAIWAYLLQDILGFIVVFVYFTIDRVHRRLHPWCPWCHWGDGGDEEAIPAPDPEDHGVKTPSVT